MKQYFVASDIHSFYTEYIKALKDASFDINNSEHILVVCGDIFDRGPETEAIYKFLKDFPKERKILVRGNHEYLLRDLVNRGDYHSYDVSNGTIQTLLALNGYYYTREDIYYFLLAGGSLFDNSNVVNNFTKQLARSYKSKKTKECLKWLFSDEWVDYYELDNYIFVHAFIPVNLGANSDLFRPIYADLSYTPDWRNADKKAFEKATWGCPWKLFDAGLFDEEIKNNKILVCGHWQASDFHLHYEPKEHLVDTGMGWKEIPNYTPYIGKNLIAIDACTAYSNKCNVIVFNELEDGTLALVPLAVKPLYIIETVSVKPEDKEN